MRDDMVMRSVYLRPDEDSALRQLAFDIKVTKSDLIRSAISAKLVEWLKGNDPEIVLKDLELGRRLTPTQRAEKARLAAEVHAVAEIPAAGSTPQKAPKRAKRSKGEGEVEPSQQKTGLRAVSVSKAPKPSRPTTRKAQTAVAYQEMAGAGM